ncbi:MAG: hypothetical protein HDS83_06540 [Bacteroidales bacterium]|nr:hypothetical protein [Bacteroidales bacterium]
MKVQEVAPFFFRFRSANDKNKSYERLVDFLKLNGWINERGDKIPPLNTRRTYDNGVCYVILSDDTLSDDFIENVNDLFESLVAEDVEWIQVEKQPSTEGIICNNAYKYQRFQSKPIQDMNTGDTVLVFKRI